MRDKIVPIPAIFPSFASSVGPLVTGTKANADASEVTATKSLTMMLGCMVYYACVLLLLLE